MNVKQVKKRVKFVKDKAWDYEVAHGAEDDLYRDVLQVIADGAENARQLAQEAIKTQKINFERYTA